jgi:hypothetical protein
MFWWHSLGPRHERFQERILAFVLVPGIAHIVWHGATEILTRNNRFLWMQFLLALLWLVVLWTVVAVVLSFSFYVGSLRFNLDLYVYYLVWLRHLKRRGKLSEREKDIVESFDFFMPKDSRWRNKRPCFIEREDLQRKSFWPNWSFSIVTLFGSDSKVRQQILQEDVQRRWVLHVNLAYESYGIYSNDGKRFLRERFLTRNKGAPAEVERRSRLINESMQPTHGGRRNWVWNDSGCQLPIRWASGGFMSVVRYRGFYWVLLSFRDITPIGLNVANGASETKEEYKDPRVLIGREFCEEVVVLSGPPGTAAELVQHDFVAHHGFAGFLSPEFARQHAQLRREHDGFAISVVRDPARTVRLLETPFDVDITFHGPNREDTHATLDDVVYTINPAEFGIEVIKLAQFSMEDEEYVIEGEINPSRKVIIRQIPVLLKLSYLFEVFSAHRDGSLGSLQTEGNSMDGKVMDQVPSEHCVIFDADVALRRSRRSRICRDLAANNLDGERRSNLEWELHLIDRWLERWGEAVTAARQDGLRGNLESERELRTLCPVTWKTLELAFAHKLFQKQLDEEARTRRTLAKRAGGSRLGGPPTP